MSKWEKVRLGDVGKIITGNTPKTSDPDNYNSQDIPFYKPGDIDECRVVLLQKPESYVSEYARKSIRVVPKDSILVTCIGTIGKVGIVNEDSACNQQINAIIPNTNRCHARFLAYLLLRNSVHLSAIANNAVVPIINKRAFSELEIQIPSLQNQQSIAEIFDSVFDLVEKRNQQLAKLDLLVKSRFVEMFGDLFGQNQVELMDICKIITDGTHQPPKFKSAGIPFLVISNIIDNEINYQTKKFISHEDYEVLIKRTPIEKGDLLVTTVGSYGNPAIVKLDTEFCFQRHIAYLKPKHDVVSSTYLHAAILNDNVRSQIDCMVKGVAQKTLNLTDLKKVKIPLPPLDLQTLFTDFVRQVDKSKFEVKQALEKLELLKDSLMQKYFG